MIALRFEPRPEIRTPSRAVHMTSEILIAERIDTATNVSVPLVQPPVGSVGAPITNRFS